MFRTRPEIDSRTIKLIIGVIALSLAPLTRALSPTPIDSISASYDAGGWAQSIFIGFLFAIAVLALDAWLGHLLLRAVPRLVLHGEATALTAFGISWLTASHTLPWLNRESERFAPWRPGNPRV